MAIRFNETYNIRERYAIVDSQGKIIEKFRLKNTALAWMAELHRRFREKLKIIELKGGNEKNG